MDINNVVDSVKNVITDAVKNVFDSTILPVVIAVDMDTETVHFFASEKGDKTTVQHSSMGYKAQPFSDEFYEKFGNILKQYQERNPRVSLQKVALVLPDQVFLTDTVNIPAIRGQMNNSLELAIGSLYKNQQEIKFNTFQMAQNKQFVTYALVGVRKELLMKIKNVCDAHGVGVQEITFAGNAMVDGAMALNPKLKNGSFLLLDIKESAARFAFVAKGKTVGCYALPFGYGMLYKSRLAAEDLLFNHAAGELLVLNAKERAKARQLTTEESFLKTDDSTEEEEEEQSFTVQENESYEPHILDSAPKKAARKLPKFMLRDTPQGKEGYMYENFRIFLKWTLDLIQSNEAITAIGAPEKVYVNMPAEYDFLYEKVNADAEEHKITFAPLVSGGEKNERIDKNLELFGGFYVKQYNRINNF